MRILCFFFFAFSFLLAKSGDDYRYSVNLNKVVNDKISVSLTPPDIALNEIDFMFPAMVPGTYEVYDFGRFISNFKVLGKSGENIKVVKIDVNTYRISPANKIEKISYDVDDTFDKCDLPGTKNKSIFEPGGTNIEAGKIFCINNHSMFGYFKGLTNKQFILEFEKPEGFYPATGLTDIVTGTDKDIIKVFNYHNLVDSPIMYSKPDTTTINVANTKVLVASFSPNKLLTSDFIASTIKELLYAQRDYLGGALPVEKYAFLFYFTDKPTQSGSYGALEHSYSSFYVLQEYDTLVMKQQIRDVAAHEFFHIVTPLGIHATEIGEFDFNQPKMSEHLWLYEGMTEYAAHHAQVKGGLKSVDEFISTMIQKYETSTQAFNDTMSFTYMSKHVLEEKIHPQYGNVYEKGALIGMCLDILLRDLSKGQYGTQNLMKDLATKYGKNKSFNDRDLFRDIENFTYPEIGTFLRKHVGGGTPLPLKEILAKAGIDFGNEITYEFSLGNPELSFNQKTKRIYVESVKTLDEVGQALGYKRKDELNKLNGRELKLENLKDVISEYYNTIKEGDKITIEILRPKFFGGYKAKTLTANARKIKTERKNKVGLMNNLNVQQKTTLKSWLNLKA